jgi:hypothetical protein
MGWLLAGILLLVWLRTRHRLKALTELASWQANSATSPKPEMSAALSQRQVCELSVLRLELDHLRAAETIPAARYAELTEHIDAVLATVVQQSWATPHSLAWVQSRDAAWALLLQHRVMLPAQPPWHETTETGGVDMQALAPPAHLYDDVAQSVAVPPLSMAAEAAISEGVAPSVPVPASHTPELPLYDGVEPELETPSDYALEPRPPSAVERALQAVSGWPALLIPLMVQNIGWFIGGFCFVAGSVFLVSYTTGFAKSLTIFSVLFTYTVLVLWAGYQLCRRRPELVASSQVLLTIGVLLVPLNIAAAVRLIVTGLPAVGPVALGCLAAALCLGGLYYAILMVSGMVDRTLQGRHPQLFLALAAMQLTVPLLTLWPFWPVLALLHIVLLGLLLYGLTRLLPDWLHAIFVEHRHITYYAAGTLVYAALVSFVHLTWGSQGPLALPAGYYGPFLMLLSGVLFYVDAQLKQWAKRDTFLSRLSFAIYGLSLLALFAGVGTPVAQVMTLVLAIALYATVMWQYVTLPPLYLLLGCSGWLYHTVVLSRVPFAGYFLASAPGLAGLYFGSWRALRLQSPVIAQMSYRIWVLAVLGLAGWSVGHGQPGPVAMATSLMVVALAFLGPRYMPVPLFHSLPCRRGKSTPQSDTSGYGHRSAWGYAGMLAAVVAVAYTPRWLGLAWATQLATGWLVLAELWTLMGLRRLQPNRPQLPSAATCGAEVWLNGALLTLFLCVVAIVGFGGMDITANRALPLLLALGGGALLQISWNLGNQGLCYGALLFWGASGIVVKLAYFPAPGSGATALSAALIVWTMLWWLERNPPEAMALLREHAEMRMQTAPPPVLLGCWPTSFRPYPDMIRRPFEHAMLLLGGVGLLQVAKHFWAGELSWSGVASAILATILVVLLAGRFRWTWLLPPAIGLGLGSALGMAYKLGATTAAGLSLVGTLYAIGLWRIGLWLWGHPLVAHCCRLLRLRGNRHALEPTTYGSAFVIMFLSLLVPLGHHGLFTPRLSLLCSLVAGMVFLWLSAQRYRYRLHAYLLLGTGAFSAVLCYLWSFYTDVSPNFPVDRWSALATDPGFGLTLILVALGLWVIARVITCHAVSQNAARADASIDAAPYVYLTPLRVVAVALALIAAVQQLGLAWLASFGVADAGQSLSILVLGLSSVTLLLANHGLGKPVLSFAGIFGGALAALWVQGLVVHGSPVCSLALLEPICADQWFHLALSAGIAACLARYLSRDPRREQLYVQPLYLVAATAYLWALLGATVLFITAPTRLTAPLPWLLLTLSVALIPVVDRSPKTAVVRGLGIGLLLTGSVVRALAINGWHTADGFVLTGWAFALWGLANFALPHYNAHWPQWRIASDAWPWFGLSILGILFAGWWNHWPDEPWDRPLLFGGYLTACALYLFLMLRNSRWAGMPWLAVLALLGGGVVFNLAWVQGPDLTTSTLLLCMGLGSLAWLNLLLWGVSWGGGGGGGGGGPPPPPPPPRLAWPGTITTSAARYWCGPWSAYS